jgi:hypothetical protein
MATPKQVAILAIGSSLAASFRRQIPARKDGKRLTLVVQTAALMVGFAMAPRHFYAPGSDLTGPVWGKTVEVPGFDDLALQRFFREPPVVMSSGVCRRTGASGVTPGFNQPDLTQFVL